MEAFRPRSKHNQVQRLDLAGSAFLRLLRVLRTVILQDSVSLRQLFPEHPVWRADVFASEAYQAFATKVAAASKDDEEPEDLQIKKALPILYDRMSALREDVKQSVKQEVGAIFTEINSLKEAVLDFTTGKRGLTIFANPEKPRMPTSPPLAGGCVADASTGSQPQHLGIPIFPHPTGGSSSLSSCPPSRLDPTLDPIKYKFSRTVTTVVDLWKEWSVGLESGPSIQQLDSIWGAKWRDQTEKQFYGRRLPVIKAIQQRHASGKASSLQEAAAQLETLRLQGGRSISLHKFSKTLKEATGDNQASKGR
jgi:hypothetical protein